MRSLTHPQCTNCGVRLEFGRREDLHCPQCGMQFNPVYSRTHTVLVLGACLIGSYFFAWNNGWRDSWTDFFAFTIFKMPGYLVAAFFLWQAIGRHLIGPNPIGYEPEDDEASTVSLNIW